MALSISLHNKKSHSHRRGDLLTHSNDFPGRCFHHLAFEKENGDVIITGWLRSTTVEEAAAKFKNPEGQMKDDRKEVVSIHLPNSRLSLNGIELTGYRVKILKVPFN